MSEEPKKNELSERAGKPFGSAKEAEILKFWQENKIFEKTLNKPSPKGEFIFYDGPPFATGLPHYGHILAGTIKDVIPRFKTMQGYRVPRRWGWDCHGLPVENLVEGELNLKSKKEIIDYGLDKFNKIAGESVLRYADEWREQVPRFGRWVDMENDYRTMDWTYTESVWWAFKTLHEKGAVYEGFKSMHLCPRCETTLSNFEVAQGYKDITDISVTAKFKLTKFPNKSNAKGQLSNVFLLAWTTTPWTLPGNVALAVNSDIDYLKAKLEDGVYVVAKSRAKEIFADKQYEIIEEFKGQELVGLEYEPLFDYYAKDPNLDGRENGWKVYSADFVSLEEGTGIVHIAPAFGSEDYELQRQEKLPFVQHVDISGKFKPEVKDFSGMNAKPKEDNQKTDIEIIKHLAHKGLLFSKKKIVHSYPHCWRCDTPLLNYASSSWFVEVSKHREKLVSENKKIRWVPSEVGQYRFGNWLSEAKDWSISRSRFWGAPIPVWKCEKCEEKKFVGSVGELSANCEKSGNRYILVRHGEAESNAKNIVSGKPENQHSLTTKGRKEVFATAQKLKNKKIDLIFASDFIRTRETAEIIASETGFSKEKIIFDDRIREINSGEFNLRPVEEYRNYFSSTLEKFSKKPPAGENLLDVKIRVCSFLSDLEQKYKGKNILIVSHEYPIWMMEAGAFGWDSKTAAGIKDKREDYVATGAFKEIEYSPLPRNKNFELELHRPFIDEIKFTCKCGGKMKRVAEVFDCWFESGSMPYAQKHYPFENLNEFDPKAGFLRRSKGYPADFIAEGLDQTRGWFYSMLVLGTLLFGKSPYKTVVVNGTILAEDGQKMSKRLKNYPDPLEVANKYGADALRLYLLASPVVRGEDLNFSEKGVDEISKKFLLRLENVLDFYKLYNFQEDIYQKVGIGDSKNALDIWIISLLNSLNKEVSSALSSYQLDKATRAILKFVDDLSTWYIRRSRDRFKDNDNEDRISALTTTRHILIELSKICAPFSPFLSEKIYQEISGGRYKRSVHLENWPVAREVNQKIIEDMNVVRRIASKALEARAMAGVKVRQPLSKLQVKSLELKDKDSLINLIRDEVNVETIVFDANQENDVVLDTNITPELRLEGQKREFIRSVQQLRKDKGLSHKEFVVLKIETGDRGKEFLNAIKDELKKTSALKEIAFASVDVGQTVQIDELVFKLEI